MSVEAGLLLPTVLVLVGLLVQPACVLYTRSVVESAAAETVRLAATWRGEPEGLRAFALRRLAAVPEAPLFHEGDEGAWSVLVEGPDESGRVRVEVTGSVRPLPLLGTFVWALGEESGGSVVVRSAVEAQARAEWIGGSYEEWVGVWE